MNQNQSNKHFELWRLLVFYGAMLVVFSFFALRLFSLQIVQGQAFLDQAEENRTRETSIQTQRGIIFDRNGYVMARNIASYNVVVIPANLPDLVPNSGLMQDTPASIQDVYRQLSKLIDLPVNRGDLEDEEAIRVFKPCDNDFGIAEIVYIGDTNAPYRPIQIKCNVDREMALMIKEKAADLPGVGIEVESVREYPTGSLTSEIIGFLGPIPAAEENYYKSLGYVSGRDKVGYAGVERELQDILGGTNGKRVIEVDVAGKELRDIVPPLEPVPGNNVRLTIDTRLQSAARAIIQREMNGWNAYLNKIRMTSGVIVAMNPKTGEILAMISEPTYENNRMTRIIPSYYYQQLTRDPHKPMLNHAISAEYPPGSVYKMVPAVGILNEGVVTPEYELEDPGKITIMQKFSPNDPGTPFDYVCYDEFGHGYVNFIEGVALSCDVYWYKVGGGYKDEVPGNGLGIWRMAEYARALGYGLATGVELPGEVKGLVPDPNWKRVNLSENWATGDTYIATMGQGYVLSTPLQVLVSINILANNGKYMQPTLVREVLDADGNVLIPFEPKLKWDISQTPLIHEFDENNFQTGNLKTVEPWVIEKAKEGMRAVVLPGGTANKTFNVVDLTMPSAGKTGTAEYCDNIANERGACTRGNWPTHSWYVGYAPYDDPEIAVVAFVYNGGEGASVAGPMVRFVMEAYFELKAQDAAAQK
jgi:penicillin-binding protein 2